MRYLALPFVLVLGLIELVLRSVVFLLFFPCTLFMGIIMIADAEPQQVFEFLKPVCFDIAKQLVA